MKNTFKKAIKTAGYTADQFSITTSDIETRDFIAAEKVAEALRAAGLVVTVKHLREEWTGPKTLANISIGEPIVNPNMY